MRGKTVKLLKKAHIKTFGALHDDSYKSKGKEYNDKHFKRTKEFWREMNHKAKGYYSFMFKQSMQQAS